MANIAQRLRQHTNVYAEAARWAIRREVKDGEDRMTFEDGSQLTFELRMVPLPETASGRALLRIARTVLGAAFNPERIEQERGRRSYAHAVLVVLIAAYWHGEDGTVRRVAWEQIGRLDQLEHRVALANFLVINRRPLAVARRLVKEMGL